MQNIVGDKYIKKQPASDSGLGIVLGDCKSAAEKGYKIAQIHEKTLRKALSDGKESISNTLLGFTDSSFYSPDTMSALCEQLKDINQSLSNLSYAFVEDLNNLHNNLSKFSVTLFGRTMTGKSTLMEILTNGNGDSIGNGSQRTTRDVRKYTWNNLEITDVPGIGAFEGEEDEQIAFHAAKTADMILFLITDDGPQLPDAESFSKIISLGKPVICVCNVKLSTDGKSTKMITREVAEKFEHDNLNSTRENFLGYAEMFGQSWRHVPFVYVHLDLAFKAQHVPDPELSKFFHNISRIDYLTNRIIDMVKAKGRYLRIKTFVDVISIPVLESSERFLEQSHINSVQGKTVLEKKRQLTEWKMGFTNDGKRQITSLITRIRSDLMSEVSSFADEHFQDKNADKAWINIIRTRDIDGLSQELLADLESKVNDKLQALTREIANELKFSTVFTSDRLLKIRPVFDAKKMWNWSWLGLGFGFSVGAAIAGILGAACAGPLGIAATIAFSIMGIGQPFFKSREEKEQIARMRFERHLCDTVSKMCDSLENQMLKSLDMLVYERIDKTLKEIEKVNNVLFRLADTQRDLAWKLNTHFLALCKALVYEALNMLGESELADRILSVARVPGDCSMFMLCDGSVFPQNVREELSRVISERIFFVFETRDKKVLISRILGKTIARHHICIDPKIGVAQIPIPKENPSMTSRVRLAQQLSGIQIIDL